MSTPLRRKDSLSVGIVGLGKMGQIRLDELARNPATRVTYVADPAPKQAPIPDGVRLTPSYKEIVESDVDAVFVCTSNNVTKEVVVAALEAGKHVFCEKPPGRSVEEVEDILKVERKNPHLKLKFGLNHRYHAGILDAKRIVDSGRLGRILWLRGIYGKSGGADFEDSWRSSRELSGGGVLLDQGIHMLDLFRFFCGDFVEIKSMVSTSYWKVDVEDNAFALLRDREGRVAMLHSSSTQWKHRFTLEIYTSGGYLSVNGILSSTRSYGDETITIGRRGEKRGAAFGKPREEILYFDHDPSWELEINDFVRDILEDRTVSSGSSEQARKAMELVFAIYDADQSPVSRARQRHLG